MNISDRVAAAKKYIAERVSRNDELIIGFGVVAVIVVIVLAALAAARSGEPNIVYQPASACKMLTPKKAQDLLNADVHRIDTNEPQIAKDQTATSKCSYSKLKQATSDPQKMIVAAVAVRSGINDEGVAKNNSDFKAAKVQQEGTPVKDLGNDAFYNKARGQLNILEKRKWIILSYGLGVSPEKNKLEDMMKLAEVVLDKPKS